MPSSGCHLPVRMGVFRVFLRAHSGNQVLHSNVRVIAATNVDLENAIKEGRFRQDLYFWLNKIRIHMPRLAERCDDIPLLVAEFIKKHGHIRPGQYPRVQGVAPGVRQIFASHDWPGNVRELENVIEVAIALGTSAYIGREDLMALSAANTTQQAELGRWATELDTCKKAIIERAPENRRQSRRGRAPAGSQPEIFLGALQRTQHEIACRGNRRFP